MSSSDKYLRPALKVIFDNFQICRDKIEKVPGNMEHYTLGIVGKRVKNIFKTKFVFFLY